MEPVKIAFCDWYKAFDTSDNFITRALNNRNVPYVISDEPDVLFYSNFGNRHNLYKDCSRVFFSGEPYSPDFNECDYAICYDDLVYEGRYCKRPAVFPKELMDRKVRLEPESLLNRKFCNFIYSNETYGEGALLRKKFATELMKYKPIDCPGRVLNNMKDGLTAREDADWEQAKIDFISGYKFTIAFENCSYPGYSSDKLMDPLLANSVPIYWGDPRAGKNFNSDAFISVNGCEKDMKRFIDMIIELDRDDEAYLKIATAPMMAETYDENEYDKFEEFVAGVTAKGKDGIYSKDPFNFKRRMSFDGLSRKEKIRYLFFR
ncbi:MAG: hypothetical protein K5662_02370 [Lachnospiraceae bacterium]|nr:hypothetical protein [Lachnospiraceae bacterium]